MRPYLAIAAAALAACSSMTEAPMSLNVTASVAPAPAATGVSLTAPVTMDTPMAMDTTTCIGRMLLTVGDSLGPAVPAHLTFGNGYRRMVLQPDAPLAPMTTYFVHVRDSMMTQNGMMGSGMGQMMMFDPPAGAMRMRDGMGWTFTTGT